MGFAVGSTRSATARPGATGRRPGIRFASPAAKKERHGPQRQRREPIGRSLLGLREPARRSRRGQVRRGLLRPTRQPLQAAGNTDRHPGDRRAGVVVRPGGHQPRVLQLAVVRPLPRCVAAERRRADPAVFTRRVGQERRRHQAVPRRHRRHEPLRPPRHDRHRRRRQRLHAGGAEDQGRGPDADRHRHAQEHEPPLGQELPRVPLLREPRRSARGGRVFPSEVPHMLPVAASAPRTRHAAVHSFARPALARALTFGPADCARRVRRG